MSVDVPYLCFLKFFLLLNLSFTLSSSYSVMLPVILNNLILFINVKYCVNSVINLDVKMFFAVLFIRIMQVPYLWDMFTFYFHGPCRWIAVAGGKKKK